MLIVLLTISLLVDVVIAIWVFTAVEGLFLSIVAAIVAFSISTTITGFIAVALAGIFSKEEL